MIDLQSAVCRELRAVTVFAWFRNVLTYAGLLPGQKNQITCMASSPFSSIMTMCQSRTSQIG